MLLKILLTLGWSICLLACQPTRTTEQVGILKNTQGESFKLSDYRGKWVVLSYWASWCEACWQEVEDLNQLYVAHHPRTVVLLGVNFHEHEGKALKTAIRRMGMRYPNVTSDPLQSFQEISITALPAVCLFMPNGKFKSCFFGKQTKTALETMMQIHTEK